mgnify:CR=1 FL=1
MTSADRHVIEQLFLRHGSGVGSYVLARVGDAELAEEITARVFLTVVRRFDQLRGSAVGWLWAIVRSELARHFRRRGGQPLGELPSPRPLPLEEMAERELHIRLQGALERLSEEQRDLVSMKFFLGLRNLEIAEATGLTPSNVGVKLHRALRELRDLLEPQTALGAEAERGESNR